MQTSPTRSEFSNRRARRDLTLITDLSPSWKTIAGLVLWALVGTLGVLDLTLTSHGLSLGLVELNPLGQVGLAAFGPGALLTMKVLAIGVGIAAWLSLDDHQLLVPATYCLCWGSAVLANGALISALT